MNNKTYKYLLFCGDIHGDIDVIPNFLKKNGLKECAVFQVGDFGIGFENEHNEYRRMVHLNKRMSIYNSDLFVIRGNHDNPKYFDGGFNMSNLFLLKDYSIVNINGVNILGIGGAISVDRTKRKGYYDTKKNHDYWVDEPLSLHEDKLKTLSGVDIVITHSAPNFCHPFIKNGVQNWIQNDDKLEDDVNKERTDLTLIYNTLIENNDIKYWYYGHFHNNYITYVDKTKFICLGINMMEECLLNYNF